MVHHRRTAVIVLVGLVMASHPLTLLLFMVLLVTPLVVSFLVVTLLVVGLLVVVVMRLSHHAHWTD